MAASTVFFGKAIYRLRKERDWTLAELGERVGLSPQMLSRYENGEANPPYTRVEQFAKIFSVPVGELYGDTTLTPEEEPAHVP